MWFRAILLMECIRKYVSTWLLVPSYWASVLDSVPLTLVLQFPNTPPGLAAVVPLTVMWDGHWLWGIVHFVDQFLGEVRDSHTFGCLVSDCLSKRWHHVTWCSLSPGQHIIKKKITNDCFKEINDIVTIVLCVLIRTSDSRISDSYFCMHWIDCRNISIKNILIPLQKLHIEIKTVYQFSNTILIQLMYPKEWKVLIQSGIKEVTVSPRVWALYIPNGLSVTSSSFILMVGSQNLFHVW